MTTTIRPAVAGDAPLIHRFIHELAAYEKLLDQVLITVAGVDSMLFRRQPRAFCDIAEVGREPAGFALWFYSVSTFEDTTGSIWRICTCGRRRGAPVSAARCLGASRGVASTRTSSAWNGRCLTGTPSRSASTTPSARHRRRNGSPASFGATRSRALPPPPRLDPVAGTAERRGRGSRKGSIGNAVRRLKPGVIPRLPPQL